MALTPEEQAELEELQRLVQTLPDDEVPTVSTPAPEPGFLESAIPSWGDIAHAPIDMLKGVANIPSMIGGGLSGAADFVTGEDYTGAPVDRMSMVKNGLENTRDIASSFFPGGRALATYATEVGTPEERSPGQYGKMVGQDLAALPTQALALGVAGSVKGGYQSLRDKTVGPPREVLLAEQSVNQDIFANKLNVASRRSGAEDALLQRAEGQTGAFVEANPVKDINPSTGRVGFEQFETNLGDIKVNSVKARNSIIEQASKAEVAQIEAGISTGQQVKTGISFEDLPRVVTKDNGLTYGLDDIARQIPEGQAGVAQAADYLKSEFGIGPTQPYGAGPSMPTVMSEGRPLSVQEANLARQKIDGQIREWGGFDDNYLAANGINPSVKTGYIEAMKFYRAQLDGALKGKISSLVGEEAANTFTKAGSHYSMASTYEDIAGRFKRETGQAFGPGSAKAVPPGSNFLGNQSKVAGAIDTLVPGSANAKMQAQALQREGNAIRDLQTLVDMKVNPPQPMPRGWALIKTNVQNLTNIGNLAVQMGILRSAEELLTLPDEMAKKVVGIVAQNAPMLFEQNPDKVNVIDGEFQDPMGKDAVIKGSVNLSAAERAKRIGGAYENKYIPPSIPTPVATPPLPKSFDVGSINNSLDSTFSDSTNYDSSADKGTTTMLDQLNQAIAIHDRDVQTVH